LTGGGQEGGRRSGTPPLPLIVGLAEALDQALADAPARGARLLALRERLRVGLEALGGVTLNGALTPRGPQPECHRRGC